MFRKSGDKVPNKPGQQPKTTPVLCSICYEDIFNPTRIDPCGHGDFCFKCIDKWMRSPASHGICPVCRTKVNSYTKARPDGIFPMVTHIKHREPVMQSPPVYPVRDRGTVYDRNLILVPVASGPLSGYREVTAKMFNESSQIRQRVALWVRREARILVTGSVDLGHFIATVMSMLRRFDVMGRATQMEDIIHDQLGRRRARLFIRELRSWIRSPYTTLEEWDSAVRYIGPEVMLPFFNRNPLDREPRTRQGISPSLSSITNRLSSPDPSQINYYPRNTSHSIPDP